MVKLPILYSFRRCPYAIRARLALRASAQQVEHREVLLKNKPESLLLFSSKGTVPILVLNDEEIIDQSLAIMIWSLNKNDPGKLLPDKNSDPYIFSLTLIEETELKFKGYLDRYKYSDRYENTSMLESRLKAEVFIDKLNVILQKNNYLAGDKLSFLDLAIVPFIRQFASVDREWFYASSYGNVITWLDLFIHSTLFISVMEKHPFWLDEK